MARLLDDIRDYFDVRKCGQCNFILSKLVLLYYQYFIFRMVFRTNRKQRSKIHLQFRHMAKLVNVYLKIEETHYENNDKH